MNNSNELRHGCSVLIVMCFVTLLIFSGIVAYKTHYSDPHWETITVTEKNVYPGNNEEKWLVYTEDEVYCITDLLFVGFFESSDVYNELQPGKTYDVYVSGMRWPMASGYKVIRKAIEKNEKTE